MKKLLAIISAIMLTATAFAQKGNVGEITVQPMVGYTSTTAFNFKYQAGGVMKTSRGYGFTLGADFGYRATDVFYPTVGAHVVQSRVNFKLDGRNGNITTTNLAVPVLANFNISDLRLGVGIQPTFNIDKSTSSILSVVEGGVKSNTIAIPVVLGYEFKNGVTFEYRGYYDVTKSIDYKYSSDKVQTNNLTSMVTIGYKFKM